LAVHAARDSFPLPSSVVEADLGQNSAASSSEHLYRDLDTQSIQVAGVEVHHAGDRHELAEANTSE
jgi:hypothetical protein